MAPLAHSHKHFATPLGFWACRFLIIGIDRIGFFRQKLENNPKTGILCYIDSRDTVFGENVKYLDRSPIKQANVLFAYLRDYNSSTASEVYSVIPDSDGVGLAVLNRLMRAAGFQIIKV